MTSARGSSTLALDEPELSPRELAVRFTDAERYFVSEASVYRLLKAHDLITSPAFIVDEGRRRVQGQDDGAEPALADRLHISEGGSGWGWFYLSTVLDDFSRYIVAWKLCTTMKAEDVTDTLGVGSAGIGAETRSNVGTSASSAYPTTGRATSRWSWRHGSTKQDMHAYPRRALIIRMTQGKIERWHLTLKNRILLGELLSARSARGLGSKHFVAHYNHLRYHESIDNLTPADVYSRRRSNQSHAGKRKRSITQKPYQHRTLSITKRLTAEPKKIKPMDAPRIFLRGFQDACSLGLFQNL